MTWAGPPELAETGPLCGRLVWRGLCGRSRLRLDVILRAASPYLELTLAVDWRQIHELLRLELPLAQPALRLAADTSGGVIERPAAAVTARERSRWEVPVISWLAAEAAGSGLAVLLDGPQGASATPERLGVSLLRAPTWPDPGADHGPQRLRLALMPCAGGWRQAGAAEQAVRFREPPWLRPLGEGVLQDQPDGAGAAAEGQGQPGTILGLGAPHLRLIGLRCLPPQGGASPVAGDLALTVQNLSPLRQRLDLGPGWQQLGRIDGLDRPLTQAPEVLDRLAEAEVVRPWQLASYRIRRLA